MQLLAQSCCATARQVVTYNEQYNQPAYAGERGQLSVVQLELGVVQQNPRSVQRWGGSVELNLNGTKNNLSCLVLQRRVSVNSGMPTVYKPLQPAAARTKNQRGVCVANGGR